MTAARSRQIPGCDDDFRDQKRREDLKDYGIQEYLESNSNNNPLSPETMASLTRNKRLLLKSWMKQPWFARLLESSPRVYGFRNSYEVLRQLEAVLPMRPRGRTRVTRLESKAKRNKWRARPNSAPGLDEVLARLDAARATLAFEVGKEHPLTRIVTVTRYLAEEALRKRYKKWEPDLEAPSWDNESAMANLEAVRLILGGSDGFIDSKVNLNLEVLELIEVAMNLYELLDVADP